MEFKRFVSYIYGYRQNEKQQNCGFVKVEIRQNTARFIVHMYLPDKRGTEYKVYGFVRKEQKLEGILLGLGRVKNGNVDIRFQMNPERLGLGEMAEEDPVTMEQLAGVMIIGSDQSVYGTVWDDGEIDVLQFVERSRKEKEVIKEDAKKVIAEEKAVEVEKRVEEVITEEVQESSVNTLQIQEISTLENDCAHHENSAKQMGDFQESEMCWEGLQKTCPVMEPFENPRDGQYLRMEPKDLKYFPKELWHLGRNSFLLHGYYNYRYLIVGKEDNAIILGVPGTYHPMEEGIATMFGFTTFIPAQSYGRENGRFGYWCRRVV